MGSGVRRGQRGLALCGLALAFGLGAVSCDRRGDAPMDSPAAATAAPSPDAPPQAAAPGAPLLPSAPSPELPAGLGPATAPNPFGLPPPPLRLEPGRQVFAVSERMLSGARLGSTFLLYATTVVAIEGDDLLVEARTGPSYKVHAAYVVPVPKGVRLRHGDPVVAEWNGTLKHGVVTKLVPGRTSVRYTDLDGRAPEVQLTDARIFRQTEGLHPGNYAAVRVEGGHRHVLLVSRFEPAAGAPAHWLALGFGGAATLVEERQLLPIPAKLKAKVGAAVLGEWTGNLRPGVIQAADDPGMYTVKFERAGRPVQLGWGLLLPAPPVEASPGP